MGDILPILTKQGNNRVHTSTKSTPIRGSLKENGGYAYRNLLDKIKILQSKFQVNDLVRVADLRKTFSKGRTTSLSYKLYKNTEVITDIVPSNHIDTLRERYNEALL